MYISDIGFIFLRNFLSCDRYQIKQNSTKIEKHFKSYIVLIFLEDHTHLKKISQILLTVRSEKIQKNMASSSYLPKKLIQGRSPVLFCPTFF